MTIINKLQSFLLQECDRVSFIKEERGILYFDCYLEYHDETHIITCIPFTNDDDEKGYDIFTEYNNHKARVTYIFENEL